MQKIQKSTSFKPGSMKPPRPQALRTRFSIKKTRQCSFIEVPSPITSTYASPRNSSGARVNPEALVEGSSPFTSAENSPSHASTPRLSFPLSRLSDNEVTPTKVARKGSLSSRSSFYLPRRAPEPKSSSLSFTQMSSAQVLKEYIDQITDHEKKELIDYTDVYYLGLNSRKRQSDFTDQRGDFVIVPNDHIAFRYQIIRLLGRGSFGQTLQCLDHKTGKQVAIKVLKKKMNRFAKSELHVLKKLQQADPQDCHGIVQYLDQLLFRGHICIVMELLSTDMYAFLKGRAFSGVDQSMIKRIASQILTSIKFVHQNGLVHCDLKPENIMLKSPTKTGVKLIDFGTSCSPLGRMYTYIQSRYYRAPEVILGCRYSYQIDMWSFGCILAELYTGRPLFPGESTHNQLIRIMSIAGLPSERMLKSGKMVRSYFNGTEPILRPNKHGIVEHPGSISLDEKLQGCDEGLLDLISQCLRMDPAERITAEDALEHYWVSRV